MENAGDVLRRTPLFEALDEDGTRELRQTMSQLKLHRGERLFEEGDGGDSLYVVLDGKMKLTRAAGDGRENLLSVIGQAEMFGELSLFDPRPRTSSASAVTEVVLAVLPHDALLPLLRKRPEISLHMMRALVQRLRRANDVTADLVFTDVPGRVAKALLDLANRFGQQTEGRVAGPPRPDPGGAGPAGRGVPGDGQQGAGRLRGPEMADHLAPARLLIVDPERLRKRAR